MVPEGGDIEGDFQTLLSLMSWCGVRKVTLVSEWEGAGGISHSNVILGNRTSFEQVGEDLHVPLTRVRQPSVSSIPPHPRVLEALWGQQPLQRREVIANLRNIRGMRRKRRNGHPRRGGDPHFRAGV